eukprot:1270070-Rhodomonas_salina.1
MRMAIAGPTYTAVASYAWLLLVDNVAVLFYLFSPEGAPAPMRVSLVVPMPIPSPARTAYTYLDRLVGTAVAVTPDPGPEP